MADTYKLKKSGGDIDVLLNKLEELPDRKELTEEINLAESNAKTYADTKFSKTVKTETENLQS